MARKSKRVDETGEEYSIIDEQVEVVGAEDRATVRSDMGLLDWLLELPTMGMPEAKVLAIHGFLTENQGAQDKLKEFMVGASVARYLSRGFVGLIETSMCRELYLHLMELREEIVFRDKMINLVAGVGPIFPVNLFELRAMADLLRDTEPDFFNALRIKGMTSPASVFDSDLRQGPQTLMASIDIRGAVTKEDAQAARYVVLNHINLGCPVLLMAGDPDTLNSTTVQALLKNIKTFKVGRF